MERHPHLYEGTYHQAGRTLTRTTDGHQLLICQTAATRPTKSPVYLVDASSPERHYVSSVYGDEFEYRRIRYRIVRISETEVEIRYLYECRPKETRRPRTLQDARSH